LHLVTRADVSARPGVEVHRHLTPNSPELRALYEQADVFVLPSLAECFGIATVEAMASGLPVVQSDRGGSADIVEHGTNGYLVRAGDVADLGAALSAVLDTPGLARSMGRASRRPAAGPRPARR
jgi:glycosyltransferase involved in cell wall biosynthesis